MKHGVVNFLKPPGMTSSDAVVALRRLFQEKRVGHTGTLDPGAAGVLPICIGRATRLFDYLVDKDKDYLAEIAFGAATDTQDAYGSILVQRPTSVTKAALAKALPGFLGPQEQIAPMYSALKSGGKKLYELARAGEAPVEKRRQVYITGWNWWSKPAPKDFCWMFLAAGAPMSAPFARTWARPWTPQPICPFFCAAAAGAFPWIMPGRWRNCRPCGRRAAWIRPCSPRKLPWPTYPRWRFIWNPPNASACKTAAPSSCPGRRSRRARYASMWKNNSGALASKARRACICAYF